jgi:bifunctional DNA primase/polymerase-like protein/primase-like protein
MAQVQTKKNPPGDILAARLYYAELFGWESFPVPPGTKRSHKSGKNSNGRRWGASNRPSVIKRDFRYWPNANIGIPTGAENGFFVLEADTPKGHDVDGIASLRRLERKHGRLPKTLMAISPSGSLHYYFKWPKRGLFVVNSASKIAPGVDIRGEGGMGVAPPSVKAGVKYRFLNWGTPGADAPKWLLELVVRKKPKRSNGKAAHNIDTNAGLIEAALAAITGACSYQVWWEVGCALHFELGDAGFERFDAWSATSPADYDADECREKWRECRKIGTYTIGTIFHHANEAQPGWREAYEIESWRKLAPQMKAARGLRHG